MSDYEKFLQCKLNLAPFQLENYDWEAGWYSPLGSRIIGWENDAPFAFIEGYGEMVFSLHCHNMTEETESLGDAVNLPTFKWIFKLTLLNITYYETYTISPCCRNGKPLRWP